MQTTLALREAAAQLLAADAATLAQAAGGNKMVLLQADFTPSELTVIGDLTLADFDGSTPLTCGLGTQAEGLDPVTNDAIITLKSPAGGWRWETTGLTNLPQTIHGYALLDNALAVLFACAKLPAPVTLNAVNQVIDLGAVNIRQLANTMV